MNKLFKIFLLLSLVACNPTNDFNPHNNYSFPALEGISDANGTPYGPETRYFIEPELPDSLKDNWRYQLHDFSNNWYSSVLYKAREPILYNQYIGRELFRFTWLRSFTSDVVLVLEKTTEGVILIEKEVIRKAAPSPEGGHKLDYHLISEKKVQLPSNAWYQFNELLEDRKYFDMFMYKELVAGNDGAEWILEWHSESGYHVVNRWSPDERRHKDFRTICNFLIDLSSFKQDIRY